MAAARNWVDSRRYAMTIVSREFCGFRFGPWGPGHRAEQPVLAVPRSAVMDDGKLAYALVVHGGTHFEPTRITIGRSSDDWVEARTGLHEGDTVVTSANFLIDSESRLKAAISGMGGTNSGGHAGHSM